MTANRPAPGRDRRRGWARWLRTRARLIRERTILAWLIAFLIAGTAVSFADQPYVRVASVAIIACVVGSFLLSARSTVLVAVLGGLGTAAVHFGSHMVAAQVTWSGVVVLVIVAEVSILQAYRRDRLGLRRTSAGAALTRVSEQLVAQGTVPALPDGWRVEVARRPAFGGSFAGDFVSSRITPTDSGDVLDLVLVDIAGRGFEAGSRALMLSGAVGGLLGAVEPGEFFGKLNTYLVARTEPAEFCTAVYARVNLGDGSYQLFVAGHPPPVVWHGETRTTRPAEAEGLVLGVVAEVGGKPECGVLDPSDALILYSDGVVESRQVEMDAGLRRLRERAERHLARQQPGLADELVDSAADADDDRTVVVITRGK